MKRRKEFQRNQLLKTLVEMRFTSKDDYVRRVKDECLDFPSPPTLRYKYNIQISDFTGGIKTVALSHEEFKTRLKSKNPNAVFIEDLPNSSNLTGWLDEHLRKPNAYLVKSKYINEDSYLDVLTKYGECSSKSSDLLKQKSIPTIRSAKNPMEYFKEQVRERNPKGYEVITVWPEKYEPNKTHFDINTIYGPVLKVNREHLKYFDFIPGKSIRNISNKTQARLDLFNRVHNGFYRYPDFTYHSHLQTINIECPRHGEFQQKINKHIQGRGCPTCQESDSERILSGFMEELNIKVLERQVKYDWCKHKLKLPFDFLIQLPNGQKALLEFHGYQHYSYSIYGKESFHLACLRDLQKIQSCLKENRTLITISGRNACTLKTLRREVFPKLIQLVKMKECLKGWVCIESKHQMNNRLECLKEVDHDLMLQWQKIFEWVKT